MIKADGYGAILRPRGIVVYPIAVEQGTSMDWERHDLTEESTEHLNRVSDNAKRKIRYAVNLMVEQSEPKFVRTILKKTRKPYRFKFRVSFLTLTLSGPQTWGQSRISDNELKNGYLNQFLTELRTEFDVKNYVWKAERQKNGRLHFHLIIDQVIPWYALRNIWNRIQAKGHFIDYFEQKTGKLNPNSVDVHSIQKVIELAGYLVKYIEKEVDSLKEVEGYDPDQFPHRIIQGRIWGCSKNLAYSNRCAMFVDGAFQGFLESCRPEVDEAFYQWYKVDSRDFKKCLPPDIYETWKKFLSDVRDRDGPDPGGVREIYGREYERFAYSVLPGGGKIRCSWS